MISLDNTPAEIHWAKRLHKEKVLPDVNVRFAKTFIKITFHKAQFRRLLVVAGTVDAFSKNHTFRVDGLRRAVRSLRKLQRIRLFGVFYDDAALARINKADNLIEKGYQILVEVLREIEAEATRLRSQSVEELRMLLGEFICELKKTVEKENQRRKSCNPRLLVYRNEWNLVVELLKRLYPPNQLWRVHYTPSVQAVRQLAYRYKRKHKVRRKA